MQLLKKLRNKPFCNNLHFFIFAAILLFLSISYSFFYIVLAIYLFLMHKKIKLFLPIAIFLLIIIFRIYIFEINKINIKDEYICKVVDVNDDGYILKTDNCKIKIIEKDIKYKPGDYIACGLQFLDIEEKSYSNDFNYKLYLKTNGIKYIAFINNDKYVKSEFSLNYIKHSISNYLNNNLSNESFNYVLAIVLAQNNLESNLKDGYSILGLSHILAISGFHIMLLFKLLSIIILKFFKSYKRSIPIIIISIYVAILGFPKACLRALLFLILKELNNYGKIKYTSLDILSLAFIIMELVNPYNIYNQGFILSYLVSFILIFINEIVKTKNKLIYTYLSFIVIYFSTLPIVISFSNSISIFALIFSPILTTIVTWIIIPTSYILALIPKLDILLKYIFIYIDEYILGITDNAIIINVESFNIFKYVIYYVLFVLVLISIIKNKKRIKYFSIFICYILLLINLKAITPYHKITFIDVGQGDSTLIELANNKGNVLIDAFNSLNYLKSSGITKIDYLVLTHSDNDHIRDAKEIIDYFNIKNIIYPLYDAGFSDYSGIKATYKNDFYINNIKFDILAPINGYSETNSNSIVIKLVINNYSFLFSGDMTLKEEEDVISKYNNYLKADVLKVAHHGSSTSTGDVFLNLVKPSYSIVSVAKNNSYNLPHSDVINRLNKISKVYQTKDNGNIEFYIYKNKMWVLPYR